MQHALECFVRLVRALLGHSAIAESKLDWGDKVCVLGIDIEMSERGYKCRPSADKVVKWSACIGDALGSGKLLSGDASKLAGRLSWGCSHMFRRFGRAMLRPLFDQRTRRDGAVDCELRRGLVWWQAALKLCVVELRPWKQREGAPVHLFCDASGKPAHLGAVVFVDGWCMWTHFAPPESVLAHFVNRRDNQIMGLELLGVTLGLCTFEKWLRGRSVVVHCDNTGAEVWAKSRISSAVLDVIRCSGCSAERFH